MLGSAPAKTAWARSTTSASTQPPDTEPTNGPPSVTTIFAPGWRGAERIVDTTVATAALPPAASACSIASMISRIATYDTPVGWSGGPISPPRLARPAARSARR